MARRLPSLNALRAFEAAARLQSLTLAAGELNVAQAAISRHVRDLEAWLGVKLFHRTGRGVTLTDEGARLAVDLTTAFDNLASAIDRLASPSQQRRLVVSSDVSFAALWLVPRLKRFLAAHPRIDIVVDPEPRLVDYAKGEADIGIRYGKGIWTGLTTELLFESHRAPVCAPKLLNAAAVAAPADLLSHVLIREDRQDYWPAWFNAMQISVPMELGGPQVRGELAIAAAEAGAGFALADAVQAGDALMAGRLVQPFGAVALEAGYYLVHSEDGRLSQAATLFRAWVMAERDAFAGALTEWRKLHGLSG